jgi:hypothetical protein
VFFAGTIFVHLKRHSTILVVNFAVIFVAFLFIFIHTIVIKLNIDLRPRDENMRVT